MKLKYEIPETIKAMRLRLFIQILSKKSIQDRKRMEQTLGAKELFRRKAEYRADFKSRRITKDRRFPHD